VLPASEATAVVAGDTIVYQNNGNDVLRFAVTLAGTATVVALNAANNQALTISTPEMLLGPYDPAIFGQTVTITTATCTGSVALYKMPARTSNGLANPFETVVTAADSP
jgi:hypothetical protein